MKKIFSDFHIIKRKDGIPAILYSRYNSLLLFSLVTFCICVGCFLAGIFERLVLPLSFLLLALAFLFLAFRYKYVIEKKGFCKVSGTVTYLKETFGPSLSSIHSQSVKKPFCYHLRSDDGDLFYVSASKRDREFPVGARIHVFTPLDVQVYERNGLKHFSSIWAIEIADER